LMDADARIMRKMIKKRIPDEIPSIRLPPFQIFYQYQGFVLKCLLKRF